MKVPTILGEKPEEDNSLPAEERHCPRAALVESGVYSLFIFMRKNNTIMVTLRAALTAMTAERETTWCA